MAQVIDVYREWLGVSDPARPLSHYALLRLKQFEDDPVKVRAHYRKMNAHVRKFASGEYATQSQQLLNELAKAMLCLTDAKRKMEYDASLGRRDKSGGKRRSLEETLILRKVVEPAQLDKARAYADAIGVEIRDALLQKKLATPEVVMQAYAESVGLPYVELADLGVDEAMVSKFPTQVARSNSCVPVMVDDGQLLIASTNMLAPDVEDDLRLRTGLPVRLVLCTPSSIHEMVEKHYPRGAVESETVAAGQAQGPEADEKPKGLLGRFFKK